jgi:hypothetical protein
MSDSEKWGIGIAPPEARQDLEFMNPAIEIPKLWKEIEMLRKRVRELEERSESQSFPP